MGLVASQTQTGEELWTPTLSHRPHAQRWLSLFPGQRLVREEHDWTAPVSGVYSSRF